MSLGEKAHAAHLKMNAAEKVYYDDVREYEQWSTMVKGTQKKLRSLKKGQPGYCEAARANRDAVLGEKEAEQVEEKAKKELEKDRQECRDAEGDLAGFGG